MKYNIRNWSLTTKNAFLDKVSIQRIMFTETKTPDRNIYFVSTDLKFTEMSSNVLHRNGGNTDQKPIKTSKC